MSPWSSSSNLKLFQLKNRLANSLIQVLFPVRPTDYHGDNELQQRHFGWMCGFDRNLVVHPWYHELPRAKIGGYVLGRHRADYFGSKREVIIAYSSLEMKSNQLGDLIRSC